MRYLPVLVFVAAATATAGCAALFPSLEKDPEFPKYFTIRAAGSAEQSKLEDGRLFGAEVELQRRPDGYRGRSHGEIIDLRLEGQTIAGTIGSGRTELYIEDRPDNLRLRGSYGGRLSDLEVTPSKISGRIGSCQYDLRRQSADAVWFEGRRACSGGAVGAQLALPAELASRSVEERALLIAVFLGR